MVPEAVPEAVPDREGEFDSGETAADDSSADWLVSSPADSSVAGPDCGPGDSSDGDASVDGDSSVGLVESDGEVGADVDGVGDSVEGHGDGVIPLLGVGVSVPVTVTQGTGEDGETEGDVEAEVDADVDGDTGGDVVGGGGGGGVGLSCRPVSPCFRANQSSLSGSYTTKMFTMVTDGATTTTWEELYPCQGVPVVCGAFWATGPVSGLPHAQRTRGTPRPSTRTAVPLWSTA